MDVSARAQRSFARRKGTAHLNPAMSKSYRAINGLLINPFAGKSHAEMLKLIKRFREETDLDVDETLLAKAAFLSQDAQAFSSSRDRRDGLTLKPREQEALHTEATRRFNQPVKLYVLIGICSLCAAVQGWDEAAANQVGCVIISFHFDFLLTALGAAVLLPYSATEFKKPYIQSDFFNRSK